MLHINLIAARRAERRRREIIRGALVRSMAALGLLTAGAIITMTVSAQVTSARINDVAQQKVMLQDTVSRVERLQADMTALQPRVTTLLSAQNATNRWRGVLAEVSASLPENTWITSFATQSGTSEGFTITGQARSQALVGRAMLRMNRQQIIEAVTLKYTQADRAGEGIANAVNFEISGTVQPLPGAKTEDKTDGK